MDLIISLVIGGIVGWLASIVMKTNAQMGWIANVLVGIVGSFVGGFLGYLLFRNDANDGAFQASGIIGSIVGSVIALLVYRKATGRKTVS